MGNSKIIVPGINDITFDYNKYYNSIKTFFDSSIFLKYKINNIEKEGEKKCYKTFASNFTEEELLDEIKEIWLIIRPMNIKGVVETFQNMIYTKKNHGISTIPNHWGLIFQTKQNKYISLQYPPVTLQKADNKEHAIIQIINGCTKYNYYYEEENMKRVFENLKIIKKVNIKELLKIAEKSHREKYSALNDNCQKFCCNIIKEITDIDANKIRLEYNIFSRALKEEEKELLERKEVKDILEEIEKYILDYKETSSGGEYMDINDEGIIELNKISYYNRKRKWFEF